ncbi:UDP-N-acetylglucosamine 1-carboxyvinyltransferase [Pseudobacteriovorax antillogorgiicola]|uniref:UDP-N-acetylglucosamine 1-carboxyvinyltransferase n=1 Tax=Pseudobacteriovorax antillogorgiicola TaxID=1513793 RepID=A0A1Y6BVC6_9BACT|nr:UDP-N-acetylglucosamine 1-carboxyvinyltransferase [Pseudobacteriovorax antillogorgiicola]TCS52298.1 UDP-N-acetylglucosamine 1-carboxyvinyltransferase [Pseudobacteriovorax antillogorgiicola]SMF30448.1 UDP-N-acetylglucosamine 1-carboxyvinyltransferase [Pseudobacteriovorax antillogorgiicola]
MDNRKLKIIGGKKLTGGAVTIAGSSNQVTKSIIASLLTDEEVLIKGAPDVDERRVVQGLYEFLGGEITHHGDEEFTLCSKNVGVHEITEELCSKNRISVLAAGPLLHRFGKVSFYGVLGGDKIGKRPVNFHIQALQQMGAEVERDGNQYHLTVGPDGLHGAQIQLPFPSVMTTENILIAASRAKGRTIIENAAIEPEILELCKMLQKMGADITQRPNRTFVIEGVKKLKGCELRCMFDRNQAVSFAIAALATGGDVLLRNVTHDPVYSFLNFIQRMGAEFTISSKGLFVKAPDRGSLTGTHIEVEVHPGFMTDWQQPFMVLFTQAQGISLLHETVFEERLGYTKYLNEMGARITLSNKCLGEYPCRFRNHNYTHSAIIEGGTPLEGRDFALPTDIRAGKCLVVAGLTASGTTHLTNIRELERKYDNLVPKLQDMGANIETIHG